MNTIRIIDKSSIKGQTKRYKNQAGFLVLPDCVLARSGILEYSGVPGEDGKLIGDGDLICVYRPVSAIKSCFKQFSNLPLTLEHPKTNEVNPHNAKDVVVGALATNPRFETRNDGEGYVICDIIVYDEDAIKAIEKGEYEELSAGYETAFRHKRGVAPNGIPYEAEQFYLSPNHVALVERGRCGSECRICDQAEKTQTKESNMLTKNKVQDSKTSVRWLLQIGDSEEVVEITEEQAQALQEENPELQVVEMTEDEIENLDMPGIDPKDVDEEDEEDDTEKVEKTEDEEDDTEKVEKTEDEEELVYEVQFEDGTTGKMDENTYKQIQRYMDVTKKGDKAEQSFASMAILSSQATRILGDSFDMADFVRGSVVDAASIKKACIKKVMPNLVTKGLRGDALDRVFDTAVKSSVKAKSDWANDCAALGFGDPSKKADSEDASPAAKARNAYVKRMNGKE